MRRLLLIVFVVLAMVSAVVPAAGAASTLDPEGEVDPNDFRISDMGPDGDASFLAVDSVVAYNSADDLFLVVWRGDDDTGTLVDNEFEIFGQLIAADGSEIGDDFRISDMGPDGNADYGAFVPGVAYNPDANEFLVVWGGDDDTGTLVDNEREIFGQRLDGSTGAEVGANDFRISDMGPDGVTDYRASSPTASYNPTISRYLVVWEGDDDTGTLVDDEFEIFGQLIAADGSEIGKDFRISDMGPDGATAYGGFNPDVAYGEGVNRFLVVWRGDDDTGTLVDNEREAFGQLLDATSGLEVGTNDFRISDMGPDGDIAYSVSDRPTVAYSTEANRFLVVWEADDDTGTLVDNELEAFGQLLDATSGLEAGTNDFRISDMGPDGDTDYGLDDHPEVAYHSAGNSFLVVWYGDDNSGNLADEEFEVFGQLLDGTTGIEIGDNDMRLSDMGPDGTDVYDAFAPTVASNPGGNRFLVVWHGDDDTGTLVDNEREAFGQLFAPPSQFVADTVGLVDVSQGIWHLRNGDVTTFGYGNPGDLPIAGDWDGDGDATPGLYRQSDGFFYSRNSNTTGVADAECFAGDPSDVPIAGDWDGDGDDNLGIYRPSEQMFYLFTTTCTGSPMGAAQISFLFGNPGDKPVAGDWDGDGIDEVGLHRESTGFFYWRNTLDTGVADGEIFFGDPGDRFVSGDWGTVDGKDTPGLFRPSDVTFYFRHTLTQGVADSQFTWTGAGSSWLPVAGDFGLG
jgi:hypothetical protein